MKSFAALVVASLTLSTSAHAGIVVAAQRGGTLKLTGNDSVAFELLGVAQGDTASTPGLVRVIPDTGTSVNGAQAELVFANVRQIQVSLGAGSNNVFCNQLTLDGGIALKGGPDHDALGIQDSTLGGNVSIDARAGTGSIGVLGSNIGGKLDVKGGADEDTVSVVSCSVEKTLKVSLGEGNNTLSGSIVGSGGVSVKTGFGDDTVTWLSSSVRGAMKVDVGSGANFLTVNSSEVENQFSFKAKGNGDSVAFDHTHFLGSAVLQLGDGNNEGSLADSRVDKNLTIAAGSGDDDIEASGTTSVGGKPKINLGKGMNTAPAL
jgi:large repetitive protein